ncbi:unnamed protein product [Merluccius merluccius]
MSAPHAPRGGPASSSSCSSSSLLPPPAPAAAASSSSSSSPPMPDLSHLTEDERRIILGVMDRQKKEDAKEQTMLKAHRLMRPLRDPGPGFPSVDLNGSGSGSAQRPCAGAIFA